MLGCMTVYKGLLKLFFLSSSTVIDGFRFLIGYATFIQSGIEEKENNRNKFAVLLFNFISFVSFAKGVVVTYMMIIIRNSE